MRAYIVEKSEIVRDRLAMLIAESGRAELVGHTGSAGVAAENILRLRPDIVFLDIKLPDGNGLDMLESLQAQGLKTRVVVMTYDPYPQYWQRAMELGAIHFIDKATGFGSVLQILEHADAEQQVALKAA